MSTARSENYRRIPPVDRLLASDRFEGLQELYGRALVRVQVGKELDRLRERMAADAGVDPDAELAGLAERVDAALAAEVGRPLQRVLNATGIFLHTNLGRAPLARAVAARLPSLLDAYCDLELSLEEGTRTDRNRRAARLLEALTGAEAALVVNNNAAALFLILQAFAAGREVVVSRGELVEIGGSFRIPDIMAAAGASLIEVGTTNRTRPEDYEAAITERTALLLKVFPSNYRQSGYVATVAPRELVELGGEHGLPVVVDEGSGLVRPHRAPQLRGHPSLADLMASGVDLACGSGDKLLGGPQAGLIVGRGELVEACHRHPVYRAVRPDRAGFACLEAVLREHLAGRPLPVERLWPDPGEHRRRLERLAERLAAETVSSDAYLGGGSAPDAPIPGEALALGDGADLAAELRQATPPVVGFVSKGSLILDLRTVDPADDETLAETVEAARTRLDQERS